MSWIVKLGKKGKKIVKKIITPAEKHYVGYTRRIERVKTGERICAMTFDDGPMGLPASPDRFEGKTLTDVLLDTLAQYGAKGSFDVIGDTSENYPDEAGKLGSAAWGGVKFDHYPDIHCDDKGGAVHNDRLIRRMLDEGHQITNHGYRHIIFGKKPFVYGAREYLPGFDAAVADLTRLDTLMRERYGYTLTLARPPHYVDKMAGGFTSYDVYERMGYQYMAASFDGAGWLPSTHEDPEAALQAEIDAMVEPMRKALEKDPDFFCGQIIFQKDGYNMAKRTPVAFALGKQLTLLKEYGYRVVSVGELMEESPFTDVGRDDPLFEKLVALAKTRSCERPARPVLTTAQCPTAAKTVSSTRAPRPRTPSQNCRTPCSTRQLTLQEEASTRRIKWKNKMASSTSATWRRYFFLLVHIGYGRNGREAGGMKKRRQWTTYSGSGKRVAPRTRTSRVSRGKEMGVPRLWVQLIVCGALFVALIGLKLLMPGNLSALRGTLGQWLVRDADFISAFSAVGRAASGEQDWGDSLSEAYVAVFGGESKAQEVSGNLIGMTVSEQDVSDLTSARELPALAVGEQRILGFSYTTPLSGTVTSPFGWRDDPNGAGECFHYGMDIAGEEGASVACFADGTVGTVGESNILGNYVTVNHEGGFSTLYAHCSAITASAGQSVKKGDAIAKVGSTGNATGSHLHFEVHDGEEYLNPVYYAVP